jgi:hypothetical protein
MLRITSGQGFVYRDIGAKDADTGGCENSPLVVLSAPYFLSDFKGTSQLYRVVVEFSITY